MKELPILLTIFLLFAGIAIAQSNPYPVYGVTEPYAVVKAVGNGDTVTTTADSQGNYLIDLSTEYDKVTLSVNDKCTETITLPEGPTLNKNLPCKEATVTTGCDNQTWQNVGAGVVVGLIAGLVGYMGGGLKIYKNRLGNTVVQHYHKGIKAYHDANIKHSNPLYSHTRWKDDPLKCAEDVKKINEQGHL